MDFYRKLKNGKAEMDTYHLRVVQFDDKSLRENKVDNTNERNVVTKGVNCNLECVSPKKEERVKTYSAVQPTKQRNKYRDVKNIIYRSSSELFRSKWFFIWVYRKVVLFYLNILTLNIFQ